MINSLFQKGNPVPYTELYKAAKTSRRGKRLGKLSHESFSSRLDYFESVGIIEKGRYGWYLTEKAYLLIRLKILYIGEPNKIFSGESRGRGKEEIRYFSTNQKDSEQKIKIYMMLSYFGSGIHSISALDPSFSLVSLGFRYLSNEVQFNEFLTKYHLNEGALKIMRDFSEKDENGRGSKHITEFVPDPVYGIMIRITKESNFIWYEYALPGFSLSEIWEHSGLVGEFIMTSLRDRIKQSEIQEALDLLVENHAMQQVGMFEGEMRYKLRPDRAHFMISMCWWLQDEILSVICGVCTIRDPKKEVRKWLGFFYGSGPEGAIVQWLRSDSPKRNRSKQEDLNEIENLDVKIRKKFEFIESSGEVGPDRYFVEVILEYIYPQFMRARDYFRVS